MEARTLGLNVGTCLLPQLLIKVKKLAKVAFQSKDKKSHKMRFNINIQAKDKAQTKVALSLAPAPWL